MRRWRTLTRQVLLRRLPHCLISWRFLLPGQGMSVRLHRRVMLGAWPVLPRWQWLLIFFYSTILWWLLWGWLALYRNIKSHGNKIAESERVGIGRQLFGLLLATFGHGIAPRDFYRYALYRRPEWQWFDYIYEQELPHWHLLMSSKVGEKSLHLMTDKHDFAQAMAEQGIATVETVALLQRKEEISEQHLFSGRSLFLKPRCGARAKGCMTLDYDPVHASYTLEFGDDLMEGKSAILECVQDCVASTDYLVQPLLRNASDLAAIAGSEQLVTLRVISALIDAEPRVVFANLEVAEGGPGTAIRMLAIRVEDGIVSNANLASSETLQALTGKRIVQWSEVVNLCIDAHRHFPDLNTIGWDVVIENEGVKLLEGNINWGVTAHQTTMGVPALETELVRSYRSMVEI